MRSLVALGAVLALLLWPRPTAEPPARAAAPSGVVVLAEWTYRADPGDRGLARGWHRGVPGGAAVALPHTGNPGPVRGAGAQAAYEGSVGWYDKRVDVARPGRHLLRFSRAHHRATAWLDGRRLGSHVGADEPFAFRPVLEAGTHRLVVRVDWRDPEAQRDAGWRRAWFNHGGLQGRVTLERADRPGVGPPALHTRLVPGGRARVTVRAARAARGELRRGDRVVALRFAGGAATAEVPRGELWSPGAPKLWRLRLETRGGVTLTRDVGLRELRWDGGALRVNGRRVRLRGASLPPNVRGRGEALTARERAEVVAQLRAIGANATRSQRPLDDALLADLDAAGILVWLEVGPFEPAGAWWADTPARQAAARDRTLRAVRRARAHASVLAWSLTNEAAGQGRPGQAAWVDATARAIKRLDPTRPVAADLWGRRLPVRPGLLHRSLDAVGVTDYHGWYEAPAAPHAAQEALARARAEHVLRTFPGKLVVVTEFGAGGTGAGGALGREGAQAALLRRRIATFRGTPGLDGALVWTLRDFALRPGFDGGTIRDVAPAAPDPDGLLDKGLFRFDGTPKPAASAVREAFAGR